MTKLPSLYKRRVRPATRIPEWTLLDSAPRRHHPHVSRKGFADSLPILLDQMFPLAYSYLALCRYQEVTSLPEKPLLPRHPTVLPHEQTALALSSPRRYPLSMASLLVRIARAASTCPTTGSKLGRRTMARRPAPQVQTRMPRARREEQPNSLAARDFPHAFAALGRPRREAARRYRVEAMHLSGEGCCPEENSRTR